MIMSDMYEETKTNEAEELYSCSNCAITFTDWRTMRRHVQNHKQGKNYICRICQIGFFREEFLLFHLRIYETKKISCIQGNSNLPRTSSLTGNSSLPGASSVSGTSFIPRNFSINGASSSRETLTKSVTGSEDVSEYLSGLGYPSEYIPNVLYIEGTDKIPVFDNPAPSPGYLTILRNLYGIGNLKENRILSCPGSGRGPGATTGQEPAIESGTVTETEKASGHGTTSETWTDTVEDKSTEHEALNCPCTPSAAERIPGHGNAPEIETASELGTALPTDTGLSSPNSEHLSGKTVQPN